MPLQPACYTAAGTFTQLPPGKLLPSHVPVAMGGLGESAHQAPSSAWRGLLVTLHRGAIILG